MQRLKIIMLICFLLTVVLHPSGTFAAKQNISGCFVLGRIILTTKLKSERTDWVFVHYSNFESEEGANT